MKIWNFENFILESVDEMPFRMSDRLVGVIDKIDHPIASNLLKKHREADWSEQTILDTELDGTDKISFVPSRIIRRGDAYSTFDDPNLLRSRFIKHTPDRSSEAWHKGRNPIAIGRFVRKIFTGLSDIEIEKFVTKFKESNRTEEIRFEVVKGTEIGHSYQVYRYSPKYGKNNPLWHSCMNNKDYFKIYTENTDVCSMLVALEEWVDEESGEVTDKIVGRALLWKTDQGNFMDRIYYIREETYVSFIKWAQNHQYMYKQINKSVGNIRTIKNGIASNIKMEVQLKNDMNHYSPYPYLDTLSFMFERDGKAILTNEYPQKEIISKVKKGISEIRVLKLNDEDGRYYDFNF